MTMGQSDAAPAIPESVPEAHLAALELVAGVLAGVEEEDDEGAFYGRICAVVSQITRMSRCVIFRYDPTLRRARAFGAHGVPLEVFASDTANLRQAPIAKVALDEDRVVEVNGDYERWLEPRLARFVDDSLLVCTPMVAAGRWFGVIMSDRPSDLPLGDGERQLLWIFGKMAALVELARVATRQSERSRQLEQRVALGRELHEQVVQRLFGVSLALSAEDDLDAAARDRCSKEISEAMGDLRTAVQRPLRPPPARPTATLADEIERLARDHPEALVVAGGELEVPDELEGLAQAVLGEAVRNAHRHARPSRIEVRAGLTGDAFELEIVNDGVERHGRRKAGSAMGLRLLAFEALEYGGIVEFGARDEECWHVRLIVPEAGAA